MGRSLTSEALVLRAYDIGDADKFCVLLTDARGRIPVVAKGVRKPGSRWSGALQSFQHIRVDLAEHPSGAYLRSAQCLSSFPFLRKSVGKFAVASRGAELLLHFLHDTEPDPAVFALARDYFQCCNDFAGPLIFPTFQLMLLRALGLLPAFRPGGPFSPALRAFLSSAEPLRARVRVPLEDGDQRALRALCDELLWDHLSSPLRSTGVGLGA